MLPPPDAALAVGEYELGTVVYDKKEICTFGLREKEFLRHIGIFGITGTGKSNIVFKLIDELLTHKKCVFVFDWKRQYRDFLSIRPDADILIFGVGNKNVPTLQFNPLIPPPGIDPQQYLEHVAQIIANAYYCGEGVISLLRRAISDLYNEFGVYNGTVKEYPTFRDVLIYVNNIERKGRSRDWQESTIRSVEAICHGGLGRIVNVQKPTLKMDELLNRNIFLELGDLGESQKKFIIQSLLTYLYFYSMNRGIREKFQNAIIVEEAHHILGDHSKTTVKEPITDIILKEIREFGTGIIIIDQNPSLISVPALANNYVTVGMYTKHASDISALSKAMFLDENQKECLGKLETGLGIVKLAGRIFIPFLVRFPHMHISKGVILDLEIALRMERLGFYTGKEPICSNFKDLKISYGSTAKRRISQQNLENYDDFGKTVTFEDLANEEQSDSFSAYPGQDRGSPANPKISQGSPEKDEIDKSDAVNNKNEAGGQEVIGKRSDRIMVPDRLAVISDLMLKDIREHQFDGISARSKRLKVSNRKCSQAIESLVSCGIINRIDIKEKSGHRILFEIADKSQDTVSEKDGGIEHRFWNYQIAELNRKAGFVVETEKKIDSNGYVDQVITKDNVSTAIEIETGKSKPVETILRDLKLGFQKVICVATSPDAFNMITRKLKQDNISAENISVVLAQNYTA